VEILAQLSADFALT